MCARRAWTHPNVSVGAASHLLSEGPPPPLPLLGLYQMFGHFADVVLLPADRSQPAEYLEELPLELIPAVLVRARDPYSVIRNL